MGTAQYEVSRTAADRLELRLRGELDEATMRACHAEARATLSNTKAGSLKVVVELVGVDGYTLQARDEFVALQGFLGIKASQTAFITGCPKGRSLALWLSHMAGGQVLRSFAQRDDALAWLSGSAGPTTGVRPVKHLVDAERVRPRRRAGSWKR